MEGGEGGGGVGEDRAQQLLALGVMKPVLNIQVHTCIYGVS